MMMLMCITQHYATFHAQFMEKSSNIKAELKKSVAYKKSVYSLSLSVCVCVCVCVFTSIHHEGFICLGLEFHGTDQQCFVEDVSLLCQVPLSLL